MPNEPSNSRSSRTAAKKPKSKSKGRKPFTWKKGLLLLFFTIAIAVFCAIAGYLWIILNGERILKENGDKYEVMDEASIIYDVNKTEVTKLYVENREPVTFDEIPEMVRNAFIATEDRRFNEHQGVDLWSIGRAAVKDVIARSKVEGGSTITQQLAKNLFLSHDKTFFRKATEVSIALALENHKTKDEILEMYLNRIFFGKGAYGIKAASKRYFGKSDLKDLEIWEIATLAAMPKAPSSYNPLSNPEKSKERRGVVLKLMADQGYITQAQMNEAAKVDYNPDAQTETKRVSSAFIDYAIDEAGDKTGLTEDELYRGGYKIYTTLVPEAQNAVEEEFANDDNFEKSKDDQQMQGSMVIMDQHTGGLVAMAGGRDYIRKGLNRAKVPRQPGSTFKPIASYGPALDTGNYFPWSTLRDDKQSFGDYSPSDLGSNKYIGPVSFTYALQKSINLPSVWLLNEIGVKTGFDFAKKLGIPLVPEDRNLTIALGGLTYGASPIQMATAYSAFANGGYYDPAHSVLEVVDRDNKSVYSFDEGKGERVMKEQTSYYMTNVLQEVVNNGTGKSAKISGRPTAGKTGTTQHGIKGFKSSGNRDVWFVGYTPEWTGAVWMGYDKTDRDHVVKKGSGQAASLFKKVMTKALANKKKGDFSKPTGVVEEKVKQDKVNGLVASYAAATQSVTLNWSALSGDNQPTYRIYRKESTESKFSMVGEVTSNSYEDIQVVPNAQYEYYVTAFLANVNLETDPSAKVSIKIDNDLPDIEQPPVDPNNPVTDPNENGGNGDGSDPSTENPDGNGNVTPDPGTPDNSNGGWVDQGTGTTDQGTIVPDNNGNGNGDNQGRGKGKDKDKGKDKQGNTATMDTLQIP
ncbi:PBP1A family penicillin-binding protein [Paenibacillus terrigena]|uniref:PBP1A family penicillin-binding protein n=1 Tax=Paenibacillus terrigena TaxID=369333 RepID=UPI0028D81B43|nr:PBP1A family penicillin-binding protein [Paenibacillus terrigena]